MNDFRTRPKSAPGQLWLLRGPGGQLQIRILHADAVTPAMALQSPDYFVWAEGAVAEHLDKLLERDGFEYVGTEAS